MTQPDQNPAKSGLGDEIPPDEQTANPENRPLAGKRILVTRPQTSGKSFADRLAAEQAAIPILHPVIQILAPDSWNDVDEAIARIVEFDWIVFVSANGPEFFVKRMVELGHVVESFQRLKLAAIGKKSVAALTEPGMLTVSGSEIDLVPKVSNSKGLAEALIDNVRPDENLLLVRGNRGSDELARMLKSANVQFKEVVAYQSQDILVADNSVSDQMNAGYIDWVTITSPAIAAATVSLFGKDLENTKLVSISANTTMQLVELGFPPAAEAKAYNMNGVVQAMLDWEANGSAYGS